MTTAGKAAAGLAMWGLAGIAAPQLAARVWTAGSLHPAHSPHVAPARAALVLGARVWADGRPSRFLRERVEVGALLFQRGLVERVILSGASDNREGLDETASMLRTALELGVPRDAIDLDPEGVDTGASARNAAHAGIGSVIVCSQEFHLPRAVALARLAGLEAQGAYPAVLARKHTLIGYARELPASWKAVRTVFIP
jgi:vancomycin permeability regulator SanA